MKTRFKLPPQIVRLVLLTIGIVGSYFVARVFLTPESFGQYGWYRGDALVEQMSRPRSYAGKKACADCHDKQTDQLTKFGHKTLSCEVCHGPAQAHVDDFDIKPPVLAHGHCLRCHEANPSRPAGHKQINSREHYAGEKCAGCHVPHAPSEVP